MSTKVLWFSRHEMTPDQRAALGDSEILQVDKTIKHASELADEISQCDVLAIVAPVELQKEFLEQAGDKPVITAVNDRILVPTENGESKVQFSFVKWEQVKKIDIIKEDFDIGKYEKDRELENLKGFTLTKDNFYDCLDATTGQPIPTEGDVILPEKVIYNGKEQKLTNIGDAFYNCNLLKSVKIPEGVRKICPEAFYGCSNLTSIDIPNSVVEIGQDAFLYTKWLNHDRPEDQVSYLNNKLIDGHWARGNIEIKDGTKMIGDGAFYNNKEITSVYIPDGVKSIGANAFGYCSNLTSVRIPDSVVEINDYAFVGCDSLKEIAISLNSELKKIEEGAISYCDNLG